VPIVTSFETHAGIVCYAGPPDSAKRFRHREVSMNNPQDAFPFWSPSVIGWMLTVRRSIAKFALLLVLSSIALPAMAFGASHSTARSHSRSSTHVRSYKGSHRPRRAAASSVPRDRRGRIRRSAAAKHSFERQQPCPSTGRTSGRCPGYVVDHVKPLECGGADAPGNMQWQTTAAGKAKDKTEGRCR
jgi:hypothetical protein